MPEPESKISFFGLDAAGLDALVSTWGWPRFRAQQVRDWVYGKLVADPAQMTNLSKADRQTLGERLVFATARSRDSCISTGFWMGWRTCSRSEGARPSQKKRDFHARLKRGMELRVPRRPSAPRLTALPSSEKADSAR